jgi:hypothetical protein
MDESGDLSFNLEKAKTSRNFIVTFLVVTSPKPFEKLIKKTFAKLKKSQIKALGGALHAYKLLPKNRIQILHQLIKLDFQIMTIKLNKSKVYSKLINEKQVLYNYITNILIDRILSKKLINTTDDTCLIASRRETNKFLNQNFCNYLENSSKKSHNTNIKIEIKTPHEEKCLQVVDLLSWSIFRKVEHSDDSYYEILKSKLVEENSLFK